MVEIRLESLFGGNTPFWFYIIYKPPPPPSPFFLSWNLWNLTETHCILYSSVETIKVKQWDMWSGLEWVHYINFYKNELTPRSNSKILLRLSIICTSDKMWIVWHYNADSNQKRSGEKSHILLWVWFTHNLHTVQCSTDTV